MGVYVVLQTRFGVVLGPSETPHGIFKAFAMVFYMCFASVAFSSQAVRDFLNNLIYLPGFAKQRVFMQLSKLDFGPFWDPMKIHMAF